MMTFKLFNAAVVFLTCVIIGWRTQWRWRAVWLLFPLLVMADSDLSWFHEAFYPTSRWPALRAVFGPEITYRILVSFILALFCLALVRIHWDARPRSAPAGASPGSLRRYFLNGPVFIVLGIGGLLFYLPLQASELEAAIARLEHWRRHYRPEYYEEAATIVRSQAPVGDRALTDRLLGVVQDENVPYVVRSETLEVLIETSDARKAREMVSFFTAWAAKEHIYWRNPGLLTKFTLVGIPRFQRLLPEAADQEDLLTFLRLYATRVGWAGFLERALELIAESPAPAETRRACALETLAELELVPGPQGTFKKPDSVAPGAALDAIRDLFEPTWLPQLRELVRRSPDAEHFQWVALHVLAHYGDLEVLPVLDAWRPRIAELRPSIMYGVQPEKVFEGYIWQIKVQNPPSRLIEYIGSTDEPEGEQMRLWAMERALALGMPKAEIRDAILEHAASATETDGHGHDVGVGSLKARGLELGILREGDLPDVRVLEFPR